jgi:predicted component of type VI protein secretion system
VHISEAELSSLIAEGKALMVNAQLMKDGRIEIVNVNGIMCDGIPELISCPVNVAPLAAAPGHPHTVSVLMMIASSLGFS